MSRDYFKPRLGETPEHARKRVTKGIVGSKPASKAERAARRIARGLPWK
jgi:hypothetical protein